jgi:transcriptional regulator with XRE-family HTH domain
MSIGNFKDFVKPTFQDRLADVLADFVRRKEPLGQVQIVERAARKGHILSQSSVSRWINGESEPTLSAVEGLAAALGVSAAWLAFGEGPKSPDPVEIRKARRGRRVL